MLLLAAVLLAFLYYGSIGSVSLDFNTSATSSTVLPIGTAPTTSNLNVSPILPGSTGNSPSAIISTVTETNSLRAGHTVYLNPVLLELNSLTPDDYRAVRLFLTEFNVSGANPIAYSWRLLAAEGKYFSYDNARARLVMKGEAPLVLSPPRFIDLRRGICSDYSVFTSVALYLGGYTPRVLDVNLTGPVGHAATAVEYNGKLFVLDQHLPLWPITGYCHRPFDKNERIRAIYVYAPAGDELNAGFRLAGEINCIPLWLDTNHDFYLSPAELRAVSADVNGLLSRRMTYRSDLTAVARSVLRCQLKGNDIYACTRSVSDPCPGMYFYSQIFDEYSFSPETAKYLIGWALSDVPSGYTHFGYAIAREVNGTHEYYVVGIALGRC